MRSQPLKYLLDLLGFSASTLCAIHCALLPVAITFTAWSGLSFLEDERIELGMIVLALLLAGVSLLNGYFRVHHRPQPLALLLLGFSLLMIGHFQAELSAEALLNALGGMAIAWGHLLNLRLSRRCPRCTPQSIP